jgi:uncharacterized membrane protein
MLGQTGAQGMFSSGNLLSVLHLFILFIQMFKKNFKKFLIRFIFFNIPLGIVLLVSSPGIICIHIDPKDFLLFF